jgi:hypothetical protein
LLIATACSHPPAGRAHWTLALLASALVRLTAHPTIARATVERRLAANDLKPWHEKMWCVPQIDAPYVACMEDVLELYTTLPRPGTAVVCVVDVHYASTERIRLVLDNLSTHTPAALYQAFPPPEARRVLRRLEFHYVPKHASWLNMVEIEIGILSRQCLDRRIPDMAALDQEVDAWTRARNAAAARVRWMFGIEQARTKLGRAYPSTARREAAA